jgi:hypothetical protein
VAPKKPDTLEDLYTKKFAITDEMKIATAGSCFAQHIARNMRHRGYQVIDAEPPPPGVSGKVSAAYGYGIYSARYGNIYYARQLLQVAQEALGFWQPSDWIWEKEGRFYDAMRPSVEPKGLSSAEEVVAQRRKHLSHVRTVLETCDLFVFTFGLTESWTHVASGTVYPTAPGTIAGSFDPDVHSFVNFGFNDVYTDFLAFKALLEGINPDVKFLVTVSPVPLAATASDNHVLPATVYSKSVLRAVAGQLADEFINVDYFPSFEIITNVLAGSSFYDVGSGLRNVTGQGVETAMSYFFTQHNVTTGSPEKVLSDEDVMCEEIMLEAFGS